MVIFANLLIEPVITINKEFIPYQTSNKKRDSTGDKVVALVRSFLPNNVLMKRFLAILKTLKIR